LPFTTLTAFPALTVTTTIAAATLQGADGIAQLFNLALVSALLRFHFFKQLDDFLEAVQRPADRLNRLQRIVNRRVNRTLGSGTKVSRRFPRLLLRGRRTMLRPAAMLLVLGMLLASTSAIATTVAPGLLLWSRTLRRRRNLACDRFAWDVQGFSRSFRIRFRAFIRCRFIARIRVIPVRNILERRALSCVAGVGALELLRDIRV
jgi:hypothetical protein